MNGKVIPIVLGFAGGVTVVLLLLTLVGIVIVMDEVDQVQEDLAGIHKQLDVMEQNQTIMMQDHQAMHMDIATLTRLQSEGREENFWAYLLQLMAEQEGSTEYDSATSGGGQ